jgi:hypothetical protein
MTIEEVEEIVNEKLDKNTCTERTLYGEYLFFFKRELQKDHYFTIEGKDDLYKLTFDANNFNPSVTETGNFPDSFKVHFHDFLHEGKITNLNKPATKHVDRSGLILEIDNVIMNCENNINRLKQIKKALE